MRLNWDRREFDQRQREDRVRLYWSRREFDQRQREDRVRLYWGRRDFIGIVTASYR